MVEKLSIVAALAAVTLNAYSSTQSLDGTWEFSRDGGVFEKVAVPHDWAIAGPFDPSAPCRSGKLPWQGYGEYRRTFSAAKSPKAFLVFDGGSSRTGVRLGCFWMRQGTVKRRSSRVGSAVAIRLT